MSIFGNSTQCKTRFWCIYLTLTPQFIKKIGIQTQTPSSSTSIISSSKKKRKNKNKKSKNNSPKLKKKKIIKKLN